MMHVLFLALAGTTALAATPVLAQTRSDYPNRPIRIIVAQAPGSGPDIMARTIGQKLTQAWGQQVIVDNRPGANGIIGMEAAAKSKPDGYTLVLAVPSALTMNPYVYKQLPYDTFRDFVPITQAATNTFGLVINPSLPVKTVKELVALGRARPGQVSYGSFGVGNQTHLAGELFAAETKIKMLHVPYKSAVASLTDLIAGQVQMTFQFMPTALPHVKSGKLRALGVSSMKRTPLAPDLPTIIEAGLPGFEVIGWNGVHVPRGTPRAVIMRINTELVKALNMPDIQERMSVAGLEPAGSPLAAFAEFVKRDLARWAKVVKDAGIQPE